MFVCLFLCVFVCSAGGSPLIGLCLWVKYFVELCLQSYIVTNNVKELKKYKI